MSLYDLSLRLVPEVSEEQEWQYLLHQTLIGELCILPLLTDVISNPAVHSGLKNLLSRQLKEEVEHAELYGSLLSKSFHGESYTDEFGSFVSALPSVTLKLFAMQSILESISLAAISYRLHVARNHPARSIDEKIYADELGHVRFGYAFLKQLKAQDGDVESSHFDRVAHELNRIFAKHFNGSAIANFFSRNYGNKAVSEIAINGSSGMNFFRQKSARSIVVHSREFVTKYRGSYL